MVDFRSETKRFFKDAQTAEIGNSFHVELDGKPLVTPEKRLLRLPTRKLADAVCVEWREQGEKIDAKRLKITQLANTAIDKSVQNLMNWYQRYTLTEYGSFMLPGKHT